MQNHVTSPQKVFYAISQPAPVTLEVTTILISNAIT